jgi:hypothetical protein
MVTNERNRRGLAEPESLGTSQGKKSNVQDIDPQPLHVGNDGGSLRCAR